MSDIKKLFVTEKGKKIASSKTAESYSKEVESDKLVAAIEKKRERVHPQIRLDAASASNFAIYGSAEKYYQDALDYIADQYPYDGSAKEKAQWELDASQLDLYVFDNLYPRTTGYAKLCSTTSGWGTLNGSITSGYGLPATKEYIQFKGGPNVGSGITLVKQFKTDQRGVGSNVYETYETITKDTGLTAVGARESNLEVDLQNGVTVEFWLKKPAFELSKTTKEVIFDLWNGNSITAGDYGRLLIEIKGDAGASPFRVTCASGSAGFTRQTLGTAPRVASLADWNHYAISVKNDDTKILTRLYVNGQLDDEKLFGTKISAVTGSLIANIGALRTSPVSGVTLTEGAGKLSGSIDDFRFWKTERTPKDIGRHYWTVVDGGTNTDISNTKLGVYYKFNEGITGESSTDQIVLDYSGRITNGLWVGYPGSTARHTGSAMVESTAALKEFAEPICRSAHPDVVSLTDQLVCSGSLWDEHNSSALIDTLPAWIREYQEEENRIDLENLVQVMASYFDKLHINISSLNRLKNITYPSASVSALPFADRLLEHYGLPADEIFANAKLISKILSRSETQDFNTDIHELKNLIYQNIYNNLVGIYKSKGTEKAFRNLIRCFGIDDEVIKLNLYGDNITYKFKDNFKTVPKIRRYANFNGPELFDATVYQYTESGNANAVSFITGSNTDDKEAYTGASLEAEVFFPKKRKRSHPEFFATNFTDVSLFGTHTVPEDATSYAFQTPDPAHFHVMAVKSELESPDVYFKLTSSVTSEIPELTSSVFQDVYDNEKWNFIVRISPDQAPITDGVHREFARSTATFTFSSAATVNGTITLISTDGTTKTYIAATNGSTTNGTLSGGKVQFNAGASASQAATNLEQAIEHANGHAGKISVIANSSAGVVLLTQTTAGLEGNKEIETASSFNSACSTNPPSFFTGGGGDSYTIEFKGVSTLVDTTYREFSLSTSLSATAAVNFLSSSKRVFIGAHRTDFTGNVLTYSDAEVGNVRYWTDYVDDDVFNAHTRDLENYGSKHPIRTTGLLNTQNANMRIPQIKTLAMVWDLDTITASDGSGTFTVPDASSGSVASSDYGWIGEMTNKQHTARGYGFPASSATAISNRYINSAKQQLPEVVGSSDMVSIRHRDDDTFTREHRPVRHYFAIEKSMYQTISEEMLNMFATIVDFNNIIGAPENRYRQEYKSLEKLRQLFYEKVSNTPELDKYVEFYQWIDENINNMIRALVPASSDTSDGVQTIIESHVLERSKYWNKFPTLEMKADPPTAGLFGVNELLYNWKLGHKNANDPQNKDYAPEWYRERAERTHGSISSGNSKVDEVRETIRNITGRHRDEYRKVTTLDGTTYSGSAYAVSRFTKPYRLLVEESRTIHGGANSDKNKDLSIIKAATYPQGFDNDAGYPVNVVLFDDIHIDKSKPHRADLDPSQAVSGRTVLPSSGSIWSEYPHSKLRYDFKARLLRDYGEGKYESGSHPPDYHTTMPGDFVAPFSLYHTTVKSTFYKYIHERLYPNLAITNLHLDTYGRGNDRPMQGPFTDTHVGGRQHRHIDINAGGDNFENRAEAWKILIGPTSASAAPTSTSPWYTDPYMLGVVGPDYPWPPMADSITGILPMERPRATMLRDEGAKRPLNIRNIKFGTGSFSIGNYQFDHQIVQAHDRATNNSAFVAAGGYSPTVQPSPYTGISSSAKPQRGRSAHVFVSRFSAPGGPEQAGDANHGSGLDIESGQYSPYNTLNYRNLHVRGGGRWPDGIRELLTNHTKQFGYFSDTMNRTNGATADRVFETNVRTWDYGGRLNFHRTNRNARRRVDFGNPICDENSDNWNKKAQEWRRTDGEHCNFGAGFVTIPLPNYSPTGRKVAEEKVRFERSVETNPNGVVVEKDPNNNEERVIQAGDVRRANGSGLISHGKTLTLDAAGRFRLRKDYVGKIDDLPRGNAGTFSLNSMMAAWTLSVFVWPSVLTGAEASGDGAPCKRAIFQLGSNNPQRTFNDVAGAGLTVLANRTVWLNESEQVVYEASYLTPIYAGGTSDINGDVTGYTTVCARWKTQESISEGQWTSLIVSHNLFAVAADGTPQGPNIYFDGAIKTLIVEQVAPINSIPVSPIGDSYIGRATPCSLAGNLGDNYLKWNGYMDEFSLWPIAIDGATVTKIAADPQPTNIGEYPFFNQCGIWYRFGDGHSADGSKPDNVNGTGLDTPNNRFWDMAPNGGRHHGYPSAALVQAFTNVSLTQTGSNLQLPGAQTYNQVCQYNTGSLYDNWYITHELPRSTAQYVWISGSCIRDQYGTPQDGNGEGIFGHTHPSGRIPAHPLRTTGSTYVPAVMFASSSEWGSGIIGGIGNKFGLNISHPPGAVVSLRPTSFDIITNIQEPLTGSTNQLGYPLYNSLPAGFSLGHTSVKKTSPIAYLNTDIVTQGLRGANGTLIRRESIAGLFNSIILSRQGPYGWPSWKQIRGFEHPATIYQRNNNIISVVNPAPEFVTSTTATYVKKTGTVATGSISQTIKGLPRGDTFTNYVEPPIVNNHPLTHILSGRTVVQHSYRNNLCKYSNQEINNKMGLAENESTMYDTLVEEYTKVDVSRKASEALTDLSKITFNYLAYKEDIYPKEVNRYNNIVRGREKFQFNWSSNRGERSLRRIAGKGPYHPKSFSYIKNSQNWPFPSRTAPATMYAAYEWKCSNSIWPLDATPNVPGNRGPQVPTSETGGPAQGASSMWPIDQDATAVGTVATDLISSPGELQNYHVQLRGGFKIVTNPKTDGLIPGAQYARRHTLPSTGSADQWRYGTRGMPTLLLSSYGATGTGSRKFAMSGSSLDWFNAVGSRSGEQGVFGGETEWEVPTQSGKYPFYNSYEEYSHEDLRLKAKDHSIVPEFRISEHIDYYINQCGGDFLAGNTGAFTLTGSTHANSEDSDFYSVYSHSDFMKKFDVIDKDHESFGGAQRIELNCSAYIKLLPYEGFYPAQRTVQLASLFSQSFGPSLYQIADYRHGSSPGTAGQLDPGNYLGPAGASADERKTAALWSIAMRPTFAPGIMFNTIKSGIAVDYPIMTGSFKTLEDPKVHGSRWSGANGYNHNSNIPAWSATYDYTASGHFITEPKFHHRIPFEAIVDPQQHITDLKITNMEPHPSGSLNLNYTASIGTPTNDLYRMAAHNFFGEVPHFFLQDESLSAITSLPENHEGFGFVSKAAANKNKKYAALVKIRKSVTGHQNFNPLSGAYSPDNNVWEVGPLNVRELGTDKPVPHPWSLGTPTINMYSRPSAFGPPSMGKWGSAAGYNMPYTPPYYDGGAWAYLEFEPPSGSKKYTLDEILGSTEVIYTRAGRQNVLQMPVKVGGNLLHPQQHGAGLHVANWPWSTTMNNALAKKAQQAGGYNLADGDGNILEKVNFMHDPYPQGRDLIDENAMQISASVNLFQRATVKTAEYDAVTGLATSYSDNPNANLKTWVIQTKFETPILNFQTSGSKGRTYAKESSAYGMWHQYGEYPENENVGVFMEITDVPYEFLTRGLGKTPAEAAKTKSLADLVGFPTDPIKLGRPASSKTVSEAIVAAPFIEKDGERHFFNISRAAVEEALSQAVGNAPKSEEDIQAEHIPGPSVVEMVKSMNKYVFPPKMDFLTNNDIEPFAMYVFEFSTKLDRQDLTDIWQNVLPEIGRKFEHKTVSVSHDLLPSELMGCDSRVTGQSLQDQLQWMVFKVKQKAQKNYYDNITGTSTAAPENMLSNYIIATDGTKSKLIPMNYSYNWPYDYFSLVELAKIDSTVEYGEDPRAVLEKVVNVNLENVNTNIADIVDEG